MSARPRRTRLTLGVFAALPLIGACGPEGADSSAEREGPADGIGVADLADAVFQSEAGPYQVQTVADGLNVPRGMQFLPAGDILVTGKDPGALRVVSGGALDPRAVAGVTSSVPRSVS